MAVIGPAKKVYSVPEPIEAPVFGKPIRREEPAQPERELVPARQPQKVGQ